MVKLKSQMFRLPNDNLGNKWQPSVFVASLGVCLAILQGQIVSKTKRNVTTFSKSPTLKYMF